MSLSELDREALVTAFSGSSRSPAHLAFLAEPAVEQIVARHVTAALTEAADKLPELTEGIDGIGTARWPIHDAEIYSLAIEEARAAIRSLADPP